MSAAEKFEALLSAIARNDDGAALAGLLPQIVAVVAAAEKVNVSQMDDYDASLIRAALAALDEALSPPTGGDAA